MKLISALVLAFSALAIGACASSPQERAVRFDEWLDGRADNVARREYYINHLDSPPTCWSLTVPEARTDILVVQPADCDKHRHELRNP